MFRRRRDFRFAVTLLELLIVIGIIAILIALLLPAVQRVRESANNLRCRNNVKQIALGWHSHSTQYGYYPTGGIESYPLTDDLDTGPVRFTSFGNPKPGQAGKNGQTASWMYQLLPFVDQENAWRQAGASGVRQARERILATPIPLYFCPSRGTAPTFTTDSKWYPVRASNDYAANNGREGLKEGVLVGEPLSVTVLNEASILDGLSNTLFVSERLLPISAYTHTNRHFTSAGYVMRGYDTVCGMGSKFEWYLPMRDSDPRAERSDGYFGSPHIKGINAGFGDGSVRVISYTVSLQTWIALGGRNDGGIPGPDADQ